MGYYISLAAGAILLVISLFLFRETIAFLKRTERATATVLRIETIAGSDGDTYKPIFTFRTLSNKEVTFRPAFSSDPLDWIVGDKATIAYDPANPDNAKLMTYFGSFGLPIILVAIAAPFIIIGGGYIVCQRFLQ